MLPICWRAWVAREFQVKAPHSTFRHPTAPRQFLAAVLDETKDIALMLAGPAPEPLPSAEWCGPATGPKEVTLKTYDHRIQFKLNEANGTVGVVGTTSRTQSPHAILIGPPGIIQHGTVVDFDEVFDPIISVFIADVFGKTWP